jgi:hypothetical protein
MIHHTLTPCQSSADVAEAVVLATAIATQTTAVVDMADVMTMALADLATTIAAMAVAVGTITAPAVSIAMLLTAAMAAGMAVGTADARTVEVAEAEAATTTGPLPQLLVVPVATMPLLHVRRTVEDARTRVTTIALTASSPADPGRTQTVLSEGSYDFLGLAPFSALHSCNPMATSLGSV